jgi:hypothetical protein
MTRPSPGLVTPTHDVHGLDRGRPVEGLGDGCAPVDHEGRLLLVGHRDPPDVERTAVRVGGGAPVGAVGVRGGRSVARAVAARRSRSEVEPPEAQRGIADVERGEAPTGEVLRRLPLQTGLVGAAPTDLGIALGDAPGGVAHGVEPGVGGVEMALFGGQLGVGVGQRLLVLSGGDRQGYWVPPPVQTP